MNTGGSLNVDALGMYSRVEELLGGAGLGGMSTTLWLRHFRAAAGKGLIRAEELEYTGLWDWLDMQDRYLLPQDIVDFLREGGVKIEEVVLAQSQYRLAEMGVLELAQAYERLVGYNPLSDDPNMSREQMLEDLMDYTRGDLQRVVASQGGENGRDRVQLQAKYAQHVLPGGENYREILLTLPGAPVRYDIRQNTLGDWQVISTEGKVVANHGVERGRALSQAKKLNQQALDNHEGSVLFKSSHWLQPNVLVHMRVNDRVDSAGRRILFVEEIQSDWGQQGRLLGFEGEVRFTVRDVNGHIRGDFPSRGAAERYLADPPAGVADLVRGGELIPVKALAIPKAPFVTKTDGWLSLAIKRLMTLSVQQGYDGVAFISGDQCASRFASPIRIVEARLAGWDGNQGVLTTVTDSGVERSRLIRNYDALIEVLGESLAVQLLAAPQTGSERVVTGLAERIDGNGLVKFYDTIVTSAARRLATRYGGMPGDFVLDVGGQPGRPQWSSQKGFVVTQAMRDMVSEGVPRFRFSSRDEEVAETAVRQDDPLATESDSVGGLVGHLDLKREVRLRGLQDHVYVTSEGVLVLDSIHSLREALSVLDAGQSERSVVEVTIDVARRHAATVEVDVAGSLSDDDIHMLTRLGFEDVHGVWRLAATEADVAVEVDRSLPDEGSGVRPPGVGFRMWAQGLPVLDGGLESYEGGPAIFVAYHGTTHSGITEFEARGNLDGFLGQGPYFTSSPHDASVNYAGFGPDLTLRIDQACKDLSGQAYEDEELQESLLKAYLAHLGQGALLETKDLDDVWSEHGDAAVRFSCEGDLVGDSLGVVMPVYVKFTNPANTTGAGREQYLTYEQVFDDEGDLRDEQGTLVDWISAARMVAADWGISVDLYIDALLAATEGSEGVSMNQAFELARETLVDEVIAKLDEGGGSSSAGAIFRMIAEAAGYDGIIMDAHHYFGAGGARMPGVSYGDCHMVPFSPQQVKSAIGNNGNFDASIADIRMSLASRRRMHEASLPLAVPRLHETDQAAREQARP